MAKERYVYLIDTENIAFVEEINRIIDSLDHVVPLVSSPHIPSNAVYQYDNQTQLLVKIENYEEFDYPV